MSKKKKTSFKLDLRKRPTQLLLEMVNDPEQMKSYRKDDDFEIFKEHMKLLAKK